jgi:hypothetical protein
MSAHQQAVDVGSNGTCDNEHHLCDNVKTNGELENLNRVSTIIISKKMRTRILMLAILAGVLNGCKTPDGKLSGVVSYYFNDNYGDKPDVGASIYIMNNKDLGATKIDAIQKSTEAKMWYSIIEQDKQMMNSDSSFIASYIVLSKTAYSKESKARYDKQISDFKKRIADMEKDVEINWGRLKHLKINSNEEYDNRSI